MPLLRIDSTEPYDWTAIEAASSDEGYGILEAGGFYEHLGFLPVDYPGITHMKEL